MAIAERSRRAFWIKQITLWHWVSSAVCLGGMLLFTVTGITLNHAGQIRASPVVTRQEKLLTAEMLKQLQQAPREAKQPLPDNVASWLSTQFGVTKPELPAEYSEEEIYISLPRPGGDGWATIDRAKGLVRYERTDRGWISYVNDLHKARHTGPVWMWFVDVLAVAFLVFTVTGLLILQVHAAKRPSTWPVIGLGFVLPVVLMLWFVHR